ncbi:MAG: hypothetical protein A2Z91_08565 [Deltaproteobacteria bacterium GWA2_38_16]|nr:MAG: hypothetical protein A2Z91_08565 [Deltaproteobacteria bacterium GWA2_38_16]OGQ03846.1 MAG: hypothetical protein A3D19_07130 [Deltaproteobacteria bacterium RIFCSPHIGHO2_02_FULL_38_15]OGQ31497.1 MAG: hypothetical protein A3A72_09180 [Deltaproteobacteria bacterium RIFCSPLOWO2_01_FULL_38_9]HBQ20892.1 DUF4416 domain-containing protein [Deltaproteobacteria bacterium]
MSIPKEPSRVKLIVSSIYSDQVACEKVVSLLKEKFGLIDIIEAHFPFTFTTYYHKEMGEPLFRSFLSFQKHILREALPDIKLFTNEIENSLAKEGGRRTINIDPGYINDAQLILATGKNFSHRIYLGKGIFGDLTLIYSKGEFHAQPWTYPDYQQEPILGLLKKMRERYLIECEENRG